MNHCIKYSIQILIILFGYCMKGGAQSTMVVEGTIQIADSPSSPSPGTIRWNGLNFEGWNGYTWVPFTAYKLSGMIADIDGNQYPTVFIGTQHWMAKNLETTQYSNGDPIDYIEGVISWSFTPQGAFCYYDQQKRGANGALYNWYAATDPRKVCPAGWKVPDNNDWTQLTTTLGGSGYAGGKMKGDGLPEWIMPNPGNNHSGFTALPVGFRNSFGQFSNEGYKTHFWSTEIYPLNFEIYNFGIVLFPDATKAKNAGLSIRCIEE